MEALYGSYRYTLYTKAEGAFTTDLDDGVNTTFKSSNDDHANRQKRVVFDASRSVPTADEVRPKALAMVLCIKAQNSLDDVVMWIKAYGKVTNAGVLDASTLAADIQRKANRDEVAPKAHTHRAAEINDFTEAVAALTVHQKIGTFDIYKDPGGRMIQAGTVQVLNHNNQLGGRILTWPVAFVDTPHVVLTLSGKDVNVVDVFVTYDHRDGTGSGQILFRPNKHVGSRKIRPAVSNNALLWPGLVLCKWWSFFARHPHLFECIANGGCRTIKMFGDFMQIGIRVLPNILSRFLPIQFDGI